MKLQSLSMLASACLLTLSMANAQTTNPVKSNTFKFGPTNLFANTILLGYERAITNKASIQVFGSFTLNQPKNGYYEEIKGYSGEVQVRYYLKPSKNLNGFFVAPFFKYEDLRFKNLDVNKINNNYYSNVYDPNTGMYINPVKVTMDEAYSTYYNGGLVFGYQLIIADVFVLDLYAGGGMKYTQKNYPTAGTENFSAYMRYNQLFQTGIAPKIGFRIGTYF